MIPTKSGGAAACEAGAHASVTAHASSGTNRVYADNWFPLQSAGVSYGNTSDGSPPSLRLGSRLAEGDDPVADRHRHFGLVVDDRAQVRQRLVDSGIDPEPSRGLRFRDPWGNLVEVVQYSEVQFTKAPPVLSGMGLEALGKSDSAQQELREKGLA